MKPQNVPNKNELAERLHQQRVRNWNSGFRKALMERTGKTPEEVGIHAHDVETYLTAGTDYDTVINNVIKAGKAELLNRPTESMASALSIKSMF